MKNTWADKFTRRAKDEGYLARSAYKLIEIDKHFKILKRGNYVLDIGAAPGSWLQYTSIKVGLRGRIIGVDLEPIKAIGPNVRTIICDITEPECVDLISERVKNVDVVLCDIAPSTTGIRASDQYRSTMLSGQAFELAKKFLKEKGKFVCKVFQGPEFDDFYKDVKKYFDRTKIYKPVGSRKRSKEVYVVGIGFKA